MSDRAKNALIALLAVLVTIGAVAAVRDPAPPASAGAEAVADDVPTPNVRAATAPVLQAATCAQQASALAKATPPPGHGPLAVFLGDSYTYGLGAPAGLDYASITAKAQGWRAVRLGLVGSGFVAYRECGELPLRSQIERVLDFRPSIVIVQSGLNDARNKEPASAVATRARSLLQALRRGLPAAQLFLVGPAAPMPSDVASSTSIDTALFDVARFEGAHYVSWLHALNVSGNVAPDRTHPSESGHLALSKLLELAAA